MKVSKICSTVISPRVGWIPRRIHASGGSALAASVTSASDVTDACEQRLGIGVAVALDRGDASRVGLHASERDGLVRRQGDHTLRLGEPVRGELGEVRPDLPGLPALLPAGIRLRQPRWQRASGVLGEASLGVGETRDQGVDGGGHAAGCCTTGAVSSPSRSIARLTVSPGSR